MRISQEGTAGKCEYWNGGPWSIKTETLYMRFRDEENSFFSPLSALLVPGNNPVKRIETHDSIWVSRIGVNYRFGCGYAC